MKESFERTELMAKVLTIIRMAQNILVHGKMT